MRELAWSVIAKARSWVGHPKRYCAFCGRDEIQVARLVAGSSAHICDSCIADPPPFPPPQAGEGREGATGTAVSTGRARLSHTERAR